MFRRSLRAQSDQPPEYETSELDAGDEQGNQQKKLKNN